MDFDTALLTVMIVWITKFGGDAYDKAKEIFKKHRRRLAPQPIVHKHHVAA